MKPITALRAIAEDGPALGGDEAWRRAFSGVFAAMPPLPDNGQFVISVDVRPGCQFVLSDVSAPKLRFVRNPSLISLGILDHFAVRLVVSGAVHGIASGQPLSAAAGDIVVVDLLQPLDLHLVADTTANRDITLWIPRRLLTPGVAEEHLLHGLILEGRSAPGAVLGAALSALSARHDDLSDGEFDAVTGGVAKLAIDAIQPALACHSRAGGGELTASFVTIRRYIDRHLASHQLSPELIAGTFGLSRSSLYRLFEPVGGVAAYIRNQRLARVRDEIGTPGLSNRRIGPIAYRWGFKNLSAFNRLFRDAYGITPRQARENVRNGDGGLPAGSMEEFGTIARSLVAYCKFINQ